MKKMKERKKSLILYTHPSPHQFYLFIKKQNFLKKASHYPYRQKEKLKKESAHIHQIYFRYFFPYLNESNMRNFFVKCNTIRDILSII